jgi:parallel beta-helix repeat protein
VYPGCSIPQALPSRVLHVAPGQASGDGSRNAPMSLSRALSTIRPGDTLYLSTGDYGLVSLSGQNADFVTVTAEPGQTPSLESLTIGGHQPAGHWRVTNLVIGGATSSGLLPNGWQQHPFLVNLVGASDVIVAENTIYTTPGSYKWEPEIKGKSSSQQLMGGILSKNSTCISIYRNTISNVWDGISVGGDQNNGNGTKIIVDSNVIKEFAGDGIDHYGSKIIIAQNKIVDGHDLCNNECIHTDGIQGWNYNNYGNLVNRDVLINGNTIIQQLTNKLEFPADDLHGITIFDGKWDGVRVTNNVIVSPTWHGISLYGVANSEVINNSVVSPDPTRAAWIMIEDKKSDVAPTAYQSIVRNNIVSEIIVGRGVKLVLGVTSDHNLIIGTGDASMIDKRKLFTEFDARQVRYDLHLAKNSPAIGVGSNENAPLVDLDGNKRNMPVDVGAFASLAHSTEGELH